MRIRFRSDLIATVVAVVANVLLPTPAHADGLGGFYAPPSPLAPYCSYDGNIIKDEPTNIGLPTQTPYSSRRVMYCSRDTNDQRIAVTGTVITPTLPWLGSGPRPIIGFAVGTQGLGDQCAPSYQLTAGTEYEAPSIAALLDAGYGVAVTDYQGLGTPGVHTFLNRKAEGHAVLDSIRAAQRLTSASLPAGGPVAIWGYSQGGQASAAAAELQQAYAPELQVKGVYVGAMPADIKAAAQYVEGTAYSFFSLYIVQGMTATYPNAGFLDMFNAAGQQVMAEVLNQCVSTTLLQHPFLQTWTLTKDGQTIPAHIAEQPLAPSVNLQLIGLVAPTAPVYVVHSLLDDVSQYQQGHDGAVRWCNRGATVQFDTLLVPTHILAGQTAIPLALAYLKNRFAGLPAPNNCGGF